MSKTIHGRELESHDSGNIIYYGNVLIQSKTQKLNTDMNFEKWIELISKDENFDPRKYHPNNFQPIDRPGKTWDEIRKDYDEESGAFYYDDFLKYLKSKYKTPEEIG